MQVTVCKEFGNFVVYSRVDLLKNEALKRKITMNKKCLECHFTLGKHIKKTVILTRQVRLRASGKGMVRFDYKKICRRNSSNAVGSASFVLLLF